MFAMISQFCVHGHLLQDRNVDQSDHASAEHFSHFGQNLFLNFCERIVRDESSSGSLMASTTELLRNLIRGNVTTTTEAHLISAVDLSDHDHSEDGSINLQRKINQVFSIGWMSSCVFVVFRLDESMSQTTVEFRFDTSQNSTAKSNPSSRFPFVKLTVELAWFGTGFD